MSLLHFFRPRAAEADAFSQALQTNGAIILDVRTEKEYAAGHVPGSRNLPLSQISKINVDRSVPLFVYCLSGARSAQAQRYLANCGYNVKNLGGIRGYQGQLVNGG